MIEEIRVYLMERWEKCRQKIGRYDESILPDIKKKLAREASFTNNWMVRYDFLFIWYEIIDFLFIR
jgi:hypothetical protein